MDAAGRSKLVTGRESLICREGTGSGCESGSLPGMVLRLEANPELLSLSLLGCESGAKPDRPTWQQRKTRAAASSTSGIRRLQFGFARASNQNPVESREACG
jgi:hypothetical protein